MPQTSAIYIKPMASLHGYFILLSGMLLLTLVIFVSRIYWQQARLVLMFIGLVAIVIIFVGALKINEPKISLVLTPALLSYHHRYGRWQLNWDNLKLISPITELNGWQYDELPYVGIAVKDLSLLYDHISPRLASRLVHEQRPLIAYCLAHELITFEQSLIDFTDFQLSDKRQITGPVANFFHQATLLQRALGYHLYLPQSALDRPPVEFANLLKQCRAAANTYSKPLP